MRVLYLTHYGILRPLGRSQILPYLRGLAAQGHAIKIVSFEKGGHLREAALVAAEKAELEAQGIRWQPRLYRGGASLPRLFLDVLATAREVRQACELERLDLLHCRSHVPATIGWLAAHRGRPPFIFDFRGFLAEEYVDAGLWKRGGGRYRLVKALERLLARRAAAIVVLTHAARAQLVREYRLEAGRVVLIPCCVDLDRFRCASEPSGPSGRPLHVVYAGTVTGRYRLPEMFGFFRLMLRARPGSTMTVLSNDDPGYVERVAREAALPSGCLAVESVPPEEVPGRLAGQDVGLMFLRGGLGLAAASPTKVGEYLACGLMVVAEDGFGGLRQLLSECAAGCVIHSDDPATWPGVLERLLGLCDSPDARSRARLAAEKHFDLREGVRRYEEAYRRAAGHP